MSGPLRVEPVRPSRAEQMSPVVVVGGAMLVMAAGIVVEAGSSSEVHAAAIRTRTRKGIDRRFTTTSIVVPLHATAGAGLRTGPIGRQVRRLVALLVPAYIRRPLRYESTQEQMG